MAKQQYGDQNGRTPSKAQGSKLDRVRGLQGNKGEQPDWARIPVELLGAVIAQATRDDGAIRFGYSRDGGAYAVALYMGGAPETAYHHSDTEMIEYLNQLWEALREN